jgi:hypothetical protein
VASVPWSGPSGRNTRRPGRQIAQLQGKDIPARKGMEIHLLNVPPEEQTPVELHALPGRQVVEGEGVRLLVTDALSPHFRHCSNREPALPSTHMRIRVWFDIFILVSEGSTLGRRLGLWRCHS